MTDTKREAPASPEKRAAALEIVLRRKADMPKNFVAEFAEHADDAWIAANGAQMVARAWTELEYRARMLVDGVQDVVHLAVLGLLGDQYRPLPPRSEGIPAPEVNRQPSGVLVGLVGVGLRQHVFSREL